MTTPTIVTPSPGQLRWQEAQFGLICHFGINTFHNKEWSAGQLDPATFNPKRFDAAQWVDVAQRAGMKYLILTAKHHDGFCLWPTDTTDYSVRHSPQQIDVVGEVSKACAAAGMHFGLYLSPWDRNSPVYADKEDYDRFYIAQMTELCTRYGELFEIWLDGAGSEGRDYDWDGIMNTIEKHQPNAMIFNMGRPTIRWVGNEDGLAADPCHYAVNELAHSAFLEAKIARDKFHYLPPECDVAVRQHWFWQDDDLDTLKTTEHLLGIYYRSIGNGANLLLNLGPNRDGLLDEHDVARLMAMRRELDQRFAHPIVAQITPIEGGFIADFGGEVSFDHLILNEALEDGQRVDGYRVLDADDGREIARGETIGYQKWHVFKTAKARRLKIEIGPNSAPGAVVQGAHTFLTGHESCPQLGRLLDYSAWHQKADSRDCVVTKWRLEHVSGG